MELVCFTSLIENLSSHNDLGIEIWCDDQKIFDQYLGSEKINFEQNLHLEDGPHVMKFCMKGKTAQHTSINEHGEILSDSLIRITNICLDQINIDQLVYTHAVYQHDTNGTTRLGNHKFYGDMGCNGVVTLPISIPMYLWLLEVM
jgi:hypothetical protein